MVGDTNKQKTPGREVADAAGRLVPRVRRLIGSLVDASRRLSEVDSTFEPASLRPPATPEELTALEHHVGKPLPPSLRAVLSVTNGAPNLCLFGDLFSTRDMLPGSAAYERLTALQSNLVGDMGEDEPQVPAGVLAISDRRGEQPDCVYLDPRRVRRNGEWQVVEFDHESDETRHPDVLAYLKATLEAMDYLIEEAQRPTRRRRRRRPPSRLDHSSSAPTVDRSIAERVIGSEDVPGMKGKVQGTSGARPAPRS